MALAAFALLPWPSHGQQRIDVDDHRPLSEAAILLERITGYPIHYEDPPYAHADDLQDVSSEAQRAEDAGYRLLVPRKGRLEYALPQDIGAIDHSGFARTVSGLVSAQGPEASSAVFRSFSDGELVYIVPVRIKDSHGHLTPVRSPMETKIPPFSSALPEATLVDVIVQGTSLLSQAYGIRVAPGAVPFGAPGSFPFSFPGGTMRDLFVQINRQLSGTALSYQLLYDPTQGYMLNTRLVRRGSL